MDSWITFPPLVIRLYSEHAQASATSSRKSPKNGRTCESMIEPHGTRDDVGWKTISTITEFLFHTRHCRGKLGNLTEPPGPLTRQAACFARVAPATAPAATARPQGPPRQSTMVPVGIICRERARTRSGSRIRADCADLASGLSLTGRPREKLASRRNIVAGNRQHHGRW